MKIRCLFIRQHHILAMRFDRTKCRKCLMSNPFPHDIHIAFDTCGLLNTEFSACFIWFFLWNWLDLFSKSWNSFINLIDVNFVLSLGDAWMTNLLNFMLMMWFEENYSIYCNSFGKFVMNSSDLMPFNSFTSAKRPKLIKSFKRNQKIYQDRYFWKTHEQILHRL